MGVGKQLGKEEEEVTGEIPVEGNYRRIEVVEVMMNSLVEGKQLVVVTEAGVKVEVRRRVVVRRVVVTVVVKVAVRWWLVAGEMLPGVVGKEWRAEERIDWVVQVIQLVQLMEWWEPREN